MPTPQTLLGQGRREHWAAASQGSMATLLVIQEAAKHKETNIPPLPSGLGQCIVCVGSTNDDQKQGSDHHPCLGVGEKRYPERPVLQGTAHTCLCMTFYLLFSQV